MRRLPRLGSTSDIWIRLKTIRSVFGVTNRKHSTGLLDHARRVPTANLHRAAQDDVQYINLMTEPDRYRGEPITIEGDLWRLYELDASRNAYGVSKIYEGWIFTGDSSNHPFRVVCTSLPSGIEPGENLRKPVKVTGYFF